MTLGVAIDYLAMLALEDQFHPIHYLNRVATFKRNHSSLPEHQLYA
jgi:hypothetical protein